MAASTDIKDNVPVVPEDNWGQTGDITVEDTSSSEQITYIELKGGSNNVFIAGRGKNTYFRYQADSAGSLEISFTAEGSIVAYLYYSTGEKISEHSSNSSGVTRITKGNVSSGDRFYLCVNDTYVGELIAEPVNINVAITSTSSGDNTGGGTSGGGSSSGSSTDNPSGGDEGGSSESPSTPSTPSDTTFDQYCKVFKCGDLFISNRVEVNDYVTDGLVLKLDCRDVDVENQTWTDSIGGVVFSPIVQSGNISKGSDGGVIVSNAPITFDKDFEGFDTDGDYTIEFCLFDKLDATTTQGGPFLSYSPNMCITSQFYGGDDIELCTKKGKYDYSRAEDGFSTFAVTNESAYLNGIHLNILQETASQYQGYNYAMLHGYEVGVRWYSMRVYNRKLRQDEIANNYAVDLANFCSNS